MFELETRPFEARFGTHCPFCGRSWGDPRPCGDSRADWTFRDGLRLLFADRVDDCSSCGRQIPQGRKYCIDCGLSVQRYRNRQDRHARVTKTCVICPNIFEVRADKRSQKVCSRSCGMKVRRARELAAA